MRRRYAKMADVKIGDLVHFLDIETSNWETGLLIEFRPIPWNKYCRRENGDCYVILVGECKVLRSFEEIQWERE